jgi:hypothetical protein
MPADSYCSIIFEGTFLNTVGENIDCKETVSLKVREDEIKLNFSKFQHKSFMKSYKSKEESLTALFYETPTDDLERSLIKNNNIPEDIGKIDEYLDSSPMIDSPINQVHEVPKRER